MARWFAVGFTVAALSLGGWALVRWWQTQPPDVGDIELVSITPPATEWIDVRPQAWCDRAVPGYVVYGTSGLDESELWAWFDQGFGEVLEEPTARLNGRSGLFGSIRVYGDIQVWVRGSDVRVSTYDTVSHDCLSQYGDPWDLENVYAQEGVCVEMNLVFWGVDYGKAESQEPPSDWATISFDGGQRIAHGLSDLDVVYAKESASDPWHRYVRDTDCGID